MILNNKNKKTDVGNEVLQRMGKFKYLYCIIAENLTCPTKFKTITAKGKGARI